MVDKSDIEGVSFVCRRCRAINEEPDVTTKEELVITNSTMTGGTEINAVAQHTSQNKEDMTEEELEEVRDANDEVEFVEKLFWNCAVCKEEHRITETDELQS